MKTALLFASNAEISTSRWVRLAVFKVVDVNSCDQPVSFWHNCPLIVLLRLRGDLLVNNFHPWREV